jgi:Tol biopolymer transport system component
MKRSLSYFSLVLAVMFVPACENPDDSDPVIRESFIHVRSAWSPDGLTIAFTNLVSGGLGIYLVDSSGSNLRLLKSGEGLGLSWSPDSKWIVFSANGSLFKILATGDSLTQLTVGASDFRPAWSPDTTRIVYSNSGLRILTLATGQIKTILTTGNFPTWTSTGLICFVVSSSTGSSYDYSFDTIDTTGGQRQTLYQLRTSADCAFSSMNSVGTHLVFAARPTDGSGRSQIVVVKLSTLERPQLTFDGGDYPAWSPDGSSIVYTRTYEDDGGLWIMDADGSDKRRLTQP